MTATCSEVLEIKRTEVSKVNVLTTKHLLLAEERGMYIKNYDKELKIHYTYLTP